MNTQEYIDSGILELFVLDELSYKERVEVITNANKYPIIKKEIKAIEDTLYLYSLQRAVPPPPSLEAKIMYKIDSIPPSGGNLLSDSGNKWLSPLLSGLLIATIGFGGWMFFDNNNKEEQLTALNTQLETQQIACDEIEADNKILEEQMRMIRTASNKIIRMKGTDKAPEAIATIYWNPDAQKTYLDVNSMPAAPTGKQYQLWAIVDGTPVDMGVFDIELTAKMLQEVPHIEDAQAFAVTLEPQGGNKIPTLDEMYVVGEVS